MRRVLRRQGGVLEAVSAQNNLNLLLTNSSYDLHRYRLLSWPIISFFPEQRKNRKAPLDVMAHRRQGAPRNDAGSLCATFDPAWVC